jgi:hypothetical protein
MPHAGRSQSRRSVSTSTNHHSSSPASSTRQWCQTPQPLLWRDISTRQWHNQSFPIRQSLKSVGSLPFYREYSCIKDLALALKLRHVLSLEWRHNLWISLQTDMPPTLLCYVALEKLCFHRFRIWMTWNWTGSGPQPSAPPGPSSSAPPRPSMVTDKSSDQ